jgi:hypothetical protein
MAPSGRQRAVRARGLRRVSETFGASKSLFMKGSRAIMEAVMTAGGMFAATRDGLRASFAFVKVKERCLPRYRAGAAMRTRALIC